jgi:hypothetical protein
LAGDVCRSESEGEVFDEVLTGVIEPMSIVDDHELWHSAPQLLVGVGDVPAKLVGDITLLGHDDDAVSGAARCSLTDEPFDEGRLADTRGSVEYDDDRLAGDCRCQPPRQLGAL